MQINVLSHGQWEQHGLFCDAVNYQYFILKLNKPCDKNLQMTCNNLKEHQTLDLQKTNILISHLNIDTSAWI